MAEAWPRQMGRDPRQLPQQARQPRIDMLRIAKTRTPSDAVKVWGITCTLLPGATGTDCNSREVLLARFYMEWIYAI